MGLSQKLLRYGSFIFTIALALSLLFSGITASIEYFQSDNLDKLSSQIKELKHLKSENLKYKSRLKSLSGLINERSVFSLSLMKISNCIPEKVWLKDMEVQNKVISITGQAFSEEKVAEFLGNLESTTLFKKVRLDYTEVMNKKRIKRESGLNWRGKNLIRFGITIEKTGS